MRRLLSFFLLIVITFCGCKKQQELIIFHAGSLSVPFRDLSDEFEKRNPGIKVLLEPAGSLVCARKITELKKPCDIIASADYFVINELLIPEYASWSIRFATNEMVLAYNDKSKMAGEITVDNWYDVISSDKVIYSRANPDADPGGYRTVFVLKLAEKYYSKMGIAERLMNKDINYIRPKEVDLIALLESNALDYIFIYKSVAIQHNLKYVKLPPEINLALPAFNELYKTVSLEVVGSSLDSKMIVSGEYINYSATVLKNARHPETAVDFLEFLLSPEGLEIFRKSGQDPIIPFSTEQPELIPEKLIKYLTQPV